MSCSVSTNKVQHIWEQELNLEDWLPKKHLGEKQTDSQVVSQI